MRRPILSSQPKADVGLVTNVDARAFAELSGLALEKRLKQKRSQAYMESIVRLDAAGAVCNHAQIEGFIQSVHKEFADLKPAQCLVGIVAECFLGSPYEVHTLDLTIKIIDHYKVGQPLPGRLEQARALAKHPSYVFIEVYTDSICAISPDGFVSYTSTRGSGNVG